MNSLERKDYIKKLIRRNDKRLGEAMKKHFLLNKQELNGEKPVKENADLLVFTQPLQPVQPTT